jgi:hypothetical protein
MRGNVEEFRKLVRLESWGSNALSLKLAEGLI